MQSEEKRRDSDRGWAPAVVVCDFCKSARSPHERQQVVWKSGAAELVLADLCSRCAANADRLLELYGGRGRDALRITEKRAAPVPAARARTLGRVLVYVLVGLASFILVTVISSLR